MWWLLSSSRCLHHKHQSEASAFMRLEHMLSGNGKRRITKPCGVGFLDSRSHSPNTTSRVVLLRKQLHQTMTVSRTLHDALARPSCILALAERDMQGQACTWKGVAHSPEHGDGQVPQCCHSRHHVEPPEHSQWEHLHGNGEPRTAIPQSGAGAALDSLQGEMLLTRTRGLGAYQRCRLHRDGLNLQILEVL